MHVLIPLLIAVVAVPYVIWEHVKWKRKVEAARAERLRKEADRHVELQQKKERENATWAKEFGSVR